MKNFKAIHIHTILGIIPFVWLVSFLTILTIGTFRLGHIPQYGDPIDPNALNIGFLITINAVLLLLGIVAIFAWIIITLIHFAFYEKPIPLNKTGFVLLIIGVAGFLILKYVFPSAFEWVFD